MPRKTPLNVYVPKPSLRNTCANNSREEKNNVIFPTHSVFSLNRIQAHTHTHTFTHSKFLIQKYHKRIIG